MTADDFVDVKLTAAAEALAPVRVHGASYEYAFEPGKSVRMPAAEFSSRLEHTRMNGVKLFELAKETTARTSARKI